MVATERRRALAPLAPCSIRSPTISLCRSEAEARLCRSHLAAQWTSLLLSLPPLITHANLFSPSICPSLPRSLRCRHRLDSITPDAPLRSVILTLAVSSPSSYLILPRLLLSCRACLLSWDAAVIWQNMSRRGERERERDGGGEIKRESVTDGHKGRKTTELRRWNVNVALREEVQPGTDSLIQSDSLLPLCLKKKKVWIKGASGLWTPACV